MKRLFSLLLIALSVLSCEMIDEKLDDLLDKRDWVVFADGTELTVDVPSKPTVLNYKFESTLDWEVKTDAEWLEIDPTNGKAGKDIKIQIKVSKNKDKEGRTGYVDLTLSNEESYRITVNQAGEDGGNDDIIVDIPNNEIWYTSTDGEIVEPYSGEYNNNADALKTFGVNIVSNTYVDGKGVISFSGDVTNIGEWAFYDCTSLTSITIPGSVTSIGEWAFNLCKSLTSVTIGNRVTTIGHYAFEDCTSLTSVTIPDSVTSIGSYAFCSCDSLTSVTIGNSVTSIGWNAFSYCTSLASVTIPDSVTKIGEDAFWHCDSLKSVTIGNGVTSIGDAAFRSCSSLTSFYGKFASVDNRCLIANGKLITFAPAGLTKYTIPDSVTEIGNYTFYYCESLTSVTIGNSVTSIGWNAFSYCTSLTSVTIPDSVTKIGQDAFWHCDSLKSVYCKPTTPPTGDNYMFDDNGSRRKIYVPMESVEAYKSAEYWSNYADYIVGYDF